jgi:DNA-binding XRE family transcriptional regulator
MTISEYLKKNKLTRGQFARDVGVVRQAVSHWLDRRNYPSRNIAKKIERMTKGEVTLQDIYS